MARPLLLGLLMAAALLAQPKRVLYFSHTAGFRHSSIATAREVLTKLDPERWTVTASEDLAMISAERLREFDAVFFYTSGELALSDAQKRALLDYVRNGGGFGGAHSATDTFYTWPEYGEMIGAYFDGHPWVQNVQIDVEDPDHPATRGLGHSFSMIEEVYQHRAFDRKRSRVLLALDATTVNLKAEGVNRTDGDFALAWVHSYGRGRVFYTALGHFDEGWTTTHMQTILRGALAWLTGLEPGDAAPRGGVTVPRVAAVAEAAQYGHRGIVSPNALVTIFGADLTTGSTMSGVNTTRLAGASVLINGNPVPVIYASPGQINFRMPPDVSGEPELVVRAGVMSSEPVRLRAAETTPGIFAVTFSEGAFTLWCTGLGALDAMGRTRLSPVVTHNGVAVEVLYSGVAPGFPGLYQVNARMAQTPALSTRIRLEIGGAAAEILQP